MHLSNRIQRFRTERRQCSVRPAGLFQNLLGATDLSTLFHRLLFNTECCRYLYKYEKCTILCFHSKVMLYSVNSITQGSPLQAYTITFTNFQLNILLTRKNHLNLGNHRHKKVKKPVVHLAYKLWCSF